MEDLELLIVGNNGNIIKLGVLKRITIRINLIIMSGRSLKYFKEENENNGWGYKTFKDNRVLDGEKVQIIKNI